MRPDEKVDELRVKVVDSSEVTQAKLDCCRDRAAQFIATALGAKAVTLLTQGAFTQSLREYVPEHGLITTAELVEKLAHEFYKAAREP